MFALFLTLISLTDLNRLITVISDERTATHRKMIGPDLQALVSPLSVEWDQLSARYDLLAEMTEIAYAELVRRERTERNRREAEARSTAGVCRTCGFSDCPGADGADCPRWPAHA